MNKYIVNTSTSDNPGKILDTQLIPNEIYNLTINRETKSIQKYFLNNPFLMLSFVGFNGKLKQANQLASERKCGCFYNMPWVTKFAADKNSKKTILIYNQQVSLYRYMISFWYPNQKNLLNKQSYLRYLSMIALGMILDLKRFNYNLQNNLGVNLYCKGNLYLEYFKTERNVRIYIQRYINQYYSYLESGKNPNASIYNYLIT